MKKTLSVCAALMLCMPLAAAAFTTVNEADVSTGGSSAVSGSATVTGNSDAGADVKTTMDSGNGGTTHTEIQTESDGVVHTETIDKTTPSNGHIDIRIGTSTGNTDIEVHAVVDNGSGGEVSWFQRVFGPHASTSVSAENEATTSDSGSFGAQGGFFVHFWERMRAFFGFF